MSVRRPSANPKQGLASGRPTPSLRQILALGDAVEAVKRDADGNVVEVTPSRPQSPAQSGDEVNNLDQLLLEAVKSVCEVIQNTNVLYLDRRELGAYSVLFASLVTCKCIAATLNSDVKSKVENLADNFEEAMMQYMQHQSDEYYYELKSSPMIGANGDEFTAAEIQGARLRTFQMESVRDEFVAFLNHLRDFFLRVRNGRWREARTAIGQIALTLPVVLGATAWTVGPAIVLSGFDVVQRLNDAMQDPDLLQGARQGWNIFMDNPDPRVQREAQQQAFINNAIYDRARAAAEQVRRAPRFWNRMMGDELLEVYEQFLVEMWQAGEGRYVTQRFMQSASVVLAFFFVKASMQTVTNIRLFLKANKKDYIKWYIKEQVWNIYVRTRFQPRIPIKPWSLRWPEDLGTTGPKPLPLPPNHPVQQEVTDRNGKIQEWEDQEQRYTDRLEIVKPLNRAFRNAHDFYEEQLGLLNGDLNNMRGTLKDAYKKYCEAYDNLTQCIPSSTDPSNERYSMFNVTSLWRRVRGASTVMVSNNLPSLDIRIPGTNARIQRQGGYLEQYQSEIKEVFDTFERVVNDSRSLATTQARERLERRERNLNNVQNIVNGDDGLSLQQKNQFHPRDENVRRRFRATDNLYVGPNGLRRSAPFDVTLVLEEARANAGAQFVQVD